MGVNNLFTPLAVTIIPVGPDGESLPRELAAACRRSRQTNCL